MKFFLVISIAVLTVSCSKSRSTNSIPSGGTDTVGINNWQTYYEELPDAFPDLRDYFSQVSGHALSIVVVAADINKDGLNDLVFHLWHFRTAAESQSIPGSSPVPNRLVVLINQGNGRFADRTSQIFGNSIVDLAGGASRKVKVADLNEDGYPDWVYALNREDGRPNVSDWTNKNVAVLSNPNGTYQLLEFGQNLFHHSVDIFKDQAGRFIVVFDQNEAYTFSNGQFISSAGYPERNGGTHLFFKNGQSTFVNTLMADKRGVGENPPSISLYTLSGTQWLEQSNFAWNNWRYVNVVYSPGNIQRSKVKTYNGREYIDGGFFESTVIKLFPTSSPIPIVSMATAHVPAGINGRSSINASEIEPWNKLFSFQQQGANLVDAGIFDVSEGALNFNFIDTADLNNDGFSDFMVYPYRLGGRPVVYLNNKSGKLLIQNESKFPFIDWNMSSLTSLFVDVNNDKIEDLIYFAGNGCPVGGSCTKFVLFKGKKNLR